jgi:3-dehydroshikimate dehydratase
MIKLSAFADEVTDDFSGQMKFLVSQKIRFIEIRFVNQKNVMNLSPIELKETKNLLDDYGIGVSAIGSPIGKITIDQPFDEQLTKFKHAIELALYFRAPFIRVFSYYPPEGKCIEDYREEILERMHKKLELLKGLDVVLVHENETDIYGHSAENCVDLVKSIDSPKFKLAYDPGNFVWGQKIANSTDTCWSMMRPYVVHIHIKDWKLGNEKFGNIPGTGDGQIKELLVDLAKINYKGFLTIEPHLKTAGQFGGQTGPELFSQAIDATRILCTQAGLQWE